jgi:hypothetical protein
VKIQEIPMLATTPARFARVLAAAVLVAVCAPAEAGKPAPLALTPSVTKVAAGGAVAFQASGGAGEYHYALSVNASGGQIDPASGEYTAGAKAGTDTVTVTDAAGATQKAQVQVGAATSGADTDLGGHR